MDDLALGVSSLVWVAADEVIGLVRDVMVADPGWVEDVDPGDVGAVRRWFDVKCLDGGWVALDGGGSVVGFLGVRFGLADVASCLDDGVGAGDWVELCRAMVSPGWRRRGVLRELVGVARSAVGGRRLWLTCVADSDAHMAWSALGFRDVGSVVFAPGVDSRLGMLCVDGGCRVENVGLDDGVFDG